MRVYITSPRGKERLCKAFTEAGWIVVQSLLELPDLIVPTVDEELPFFSQNREWFKSVGIEVMVGSENTIYHCRDKAEFNMFCKRHGFLTPRTWQMEAHVKPRYGKGSRGIIKVNTSHIIQEHNPFPEVSIDYFSDLDGNFVSAIPRFRLGVVNGESQAMELVPNFDLENVKRLGKEIGLVGHNVIQGFYHEDVFWFGEVNPRFGGGSWMTFDLFNSPKHLLETLRVDKRRDASLRR